MNKLYNLEDYKKFSLSFYKISEYHHMEDAFIYAVPKMSHMTYHP